MLNNSASKIPLVALILSILSLILCIVLFTQVGNCITLEETRDVKLKNVNISGTTTIDGTTNLKTVSVSDRIKLKNFQFVTTKDQKEMWIKNTNSTGYVRFRIAPGSKVSSDYGYVDIDVQQPKNSEKGNLGSGTDSKPARCWLVSRWGDACRNP